MTRPNVARAVPDDAGHRHTPVQPGGTVARPPEGVGQRRAAHAARSVSSLLAAVTPFAGAVTPTRRDELHVIAVAVVAVALVVVVVGQALLASGQVRLATLEHDLMLEQSVNRQNQQTVAALETPALIVGAATNQLHMVRSSGVTELPYVSLSVPLPTPAVIGAPPAPATPTPATP